jgi:hypothetical protein
VLAAAIARGRAEARSPACKRRPLLAEARTPREIADAIVSSGAASVAPRRMVAEVSGDGTGWS